MADTFHWWGEDTQFSASGDSLVASGVTELNQIIVRELLTAPGDYIWHPTYGEGLGRFVGKALSREQFADIKARIRSVVLSKKDVQKLPDPTISFQSDATGLLGVQIIYTYAPTGEPQTLTFSLPK